MMKKLALIPFMLSMAYAGQSQAALTDGVYETTVNGHNAPMTAGRTHQKLSNEPRYRSPFIGDLTRGTF